MFVCNGSSQLLRSVNAVAVFRDLFDGKWLAFFMIQKVIRDGEIELQEKQTGEEGAAGAGM